ncbi:MAG: LamG domain-containing protein [Bacteroidetes bacterium]|nr:LamG domain-containing protein [Bacteroidota bacterium]
MNIRILVGLVFLPLGGWAQGSHQALQFAGTSNNYIEVTAPVNLPTGTAARTLESWVYPLAYTPGGNIVGYGRAYVNGGNGFQLMLLNVAGSTYLFSDGAYTANNITLATAEIPQAQTWSHIAFSVDASRNWKYYLNGVLIKQGTFTVSYSTPASTDYIRIAQRSDYETSGPGTGYYAPFTGNIDEVRIWSRALTPEEIRHNMCRKLTGAEPGLAAYYRMDESVAGTCLPSGDVCDASGNHNHGSLH